MLANSFTYQCCLLPWFSILGTSNLQYPCVWMKLKSLGSTIKRPQIQKRTKHFGAALKPARYSFQRETEYYPAWLFPVSSDHWERKREMLANECILRTSALYFGSLSWLMRAGEDSLAFGVDVQYFLLYLTTSLHEWGRSIVLATETECCTGWGAWFDPNQKKSDFLGPLSCTPPSH